MIACSSFCSCPRLAAIMSHSTLIKEARTRAWMAFSRFSRLYTCILHVKA